MIYLTGVIAALMFFLSGRRACSTRVVLTRCRPAPSPEDLTHQSVIKMTNCLTSALRHDSR